MSLAGADTEEVLVLGAEMHRNNLLEPLIHSGFNQLPAGGTLTAVTLPNI